jgi:excisionase family DNA binding protein
MTSPTSVEQVWLIPLADGRAAEHHRIDEPDGKKVGWEVDGKTGLDDMGTVSLPLYGADRLANANPGLMSPTQVAKILNINRSSVYRLLDQGDLDAHKIVISSGKPSRTRVTNESVRNLLTKWMAV